MIDIDQAHAEFVVLRPEGALSQADFAALASAIDTRINETDRVPNLVICLDRLPHWDSVGALASHFNFVKTHQKVVKKVAVVGDSPLLSIAPEIANFLVNTKVRRFPTSRLEEAKAWARTEKDDPGHFELIDGLPRDVVAVRAVGIITGDDYREVLMPLVEEKLKEHDKLKCLFVLDDDYTTYSGSAAWEDTKFDWRLLRDFTRVAVVTDVEWMAKAFRMFAPLMPYDFRLFPLADLEEAKGWVKR